MPLQLLSVVWISLMSFVTIDEFPVRITKIDFKYWSLMNSHPTFIFNLCKFNELWPYYQKHVNHNFESDNSLKLNFTNNQDLRSNFVDCESFPESNSPEILAV